MALNFSFFFTNLRIQRYKHGAFCARCMKGIFELKPALPKYSEIWDVNNVLGYLRAAAPLRSLSLKQLTLNLTMFLCLTTGQRGQTIHKLDVNYIQKKWMTATE